LARIVGPARVGAVCSSEDESQIYRSIRSLLDGNISLQDFETLRRDLMGSGQVLQLKAALLGEEWRGLPEGDFLSKD